MRTDEFDFELPESLIAQFPPVSRGGSRLLKVGGGQMIDGKFSDLTKYLRENDVLVLNDTRVLKARVYGEKETGGKIEILVERILGEHEVLAQVRSSKSPKVHSRLLLAGVIHAIVLGREGEFFHLRFEENESVESLLEKHGKLPLPPYITHDADEKDDERYQTIFARESGAVAAPTAGLHFDEAMMSTLRERGVTIAYVTLHVGAGTFKPVRVDHIEEHVMHSERYSIPEATVEAIKNAQAKGGRLIAVGTTSLRALESAVLQGELSSGSGDTNIFITPGFKFKMVNLLLTNFHLPRSTLLMLVSAFGGIDKIRAAYRHAIENEYRFFSYGDAMLIEREQ